jgi:hypothetical protein
MEFSNRLFRDPEFPVQTFSANTKNVCLIHPKEDVAIIVEDKQPFFHGMPDEGSRQRYGAILNVAHKECEEFVPKNTERHCEMKLVEYGTSIDVDGDGKEDYVSRFAQPAVDGGWETREFVLISGTSHLLYIPRTCSYRMEYVPFSYNAEEQSLYYGRCNLTQMSKGVR